MMRKALGIFALGLMACATASQRAADETALREQETKAPLMHYPLRAEGVPAFDTLGGRYRLMKVDDKQVCFEAVFQSENGNEQAVQFYLASINDSGKQTLVHHASALLLGVKQGMISTDNDTQNADGSVVNSAAQGIGADVTGTANSSVALTDSSHSNGPMQAGTPAPVIQTQNTQTVDPVVSNQQDSRMQSHAYMNVCFPKPADPKLAYLAVQRGDLGLMTPHPPRAVWKLAAK